MGANTRARARVLSSIVNERCKIHARARARGHIYREHPIFRRVGSVHSAPVEDRTFFETSCTIDTRTLRGRVIISTAASENCETRGCAQCEFDRPRFSRRGRAKGAGKGERDISPRHLRPVKSRSSQRAAPDRA